MKTLIVKARAGLGNRLLGLTAGITLAKAAQRTLYVDWSDETYADNGMNTFYKYFSLSNVDFIDLMPTSGSYFPKCWALHPRQSPATLLHNTHFNRQYDTRIGLDDVHRSEDNLVFWSYDSMYDELAKKYFYQPEHDVLKQMFSKHIQFDDEYEQKAALFMSKFKPCIGVHYRHMDRRTLTDVEDIFDIITTFEQLPILVCSDNIDVVIKFRDRFGSRVFTLPKWYPPAVEVSMHNSVLCSNREQNLQEAIMDVLALSHCRYLIRTKASSFSLIPELIENAIEKVVRVP
jgi:hypothetical protein